jgi:hypothetical protein
MTSSFFDQNTNVRGIQYSKLKKRTKQSKLDFNMFARILSTPNYKKKLKSSLRIDKLFKMYYTNSYKSSV